MSDSSSSGDMSGLEAMQSQAQSQYIEEAENELQSEMGAQKAQMAKAAAEAWAKAQ